MSLKSQGSFQPLLWWFAVSSPLLLWQHHRTASSDARIQFTVSMEGRAGPVSANATLNGLPYQAGSPCGIGRKVLVVRAENSEPFETNRFVWYSGFDFGDIHLTRCKGQMDIVCSTAANFVIRGNEASNNFQITSRKSISLPTGRYIIAAQFARFREERMVDVPRNQTTRVAFTPETTTLNLDSVPEQATFELQSVKQKEVALKGTTPASIPDLPAGDYKLVILSGDYQKDLPIKLDGQKATNNLTVEFRYARLSVNSDPAGAVVLHHAKVLGETPATLELLPASYDLRIAKDGFLTTNLNLTLSDTDSRTVSVTLVKVRYADALNRAQRSLTVGNYSESVLLDIEEALFFKPGDPTALALKREVEFKQHLGRATALEIDGIHDKALIEVKAALALNATDAKALALKSTLEKAQRDDDERQAREKKAAKQAEAAARRNRPLNGLLQVSRGMKYQELFAPQTLRHQGTLDSVRAAVVRAFGQKPEWNIERSEKLKNDTEVFQAGASGKGWMQNVVLVFGETEDNEVTICFKLFAFVVGEGQESGFFKPLHPQYATTIDPRVAKDYLDKETDRFRERLSAALR